MSINTMLSTCLRAVGSITTDPGGILAVHTTEVTFATIADPNNLFPLTSVSQVEQACTPLIPLPPDILHLLQDSPHSILFLAHCVGCWKNQSYSRSIHAVNKGNPIGKHIQRVNLEGSLEGVEGITERQGLRCKIAESLSMNHTVSSEHRLHGRSRTPCTKMPHYYGNRCRIPTSDTTGREARRFTILGSQPACVSCLRFILVPHERNVSRVSYYISRLTLHHRY